MRIDRRAVAAELGFRPQEAVRWFDPRVLLITAAKAAASAVFGAFADKRELQAIFGQDDLDLAGEPGDLWFDYVADLGDSFDATYTIAWLLAAPELEVGGERTRRGRLLVLGGDEVYPTASARAYAERTLGPYAAALPRADPAPILLAVPGNHDWYDGLTAFLRVFATGARIGGWETWQRRSYFAVALPSRWWLLAVDVQFDTYIDTPQLDYFRRVCADLGPGDTVILCTARPSWLDAGADPEAFASLAAFEREIVTGRGARVALWLSGDRHHYCHYAGPDRTMLTCGGGGAYLSSTHHLPAEITVDGARLTRRQSYPSQARSRTLSLGVFRLPWRNPAFAALLGLAHVLMLLSLGAGLSAFDAGSAGGGAGPGGQSDGIVRAIGAAGWADAATSALRPFALSVAGALLAGAWVISGWASRRAVAAGAAHALAQVTLAVGWVVLCAAVFAFADPGGLPTPVAGALLAALTFVAGGFVGSLLTAAYLLLADLVGVNANEVFAAQGIVDHKSFLRCRISADGTLTVIPVKVDRVCRRWELAAPGAGPRIRPKPGREPRAEPIDEPIRVTRS